MLTMQVFYNRLVTKGENHRTCVRSLEQLTRANLAQIRAVKSDLLWETWHAENASA